MMMIMGHECTWEVVWVIRGREKKRILRGERRWKYTTYTHTHTHIERERETA
jgi:hypothetical protein